MGIKFIYYLPGINPIAVQDRIDAGFHTPHMSLREDRALIVVKTVGVGRSLSNECRSCGMGRNDFYSSENPDL